MIRLHEFITKIRNCKTIAEERAQYQKEMAAIRESFAKNQENLRPRNVTKLLFINMSGQETNFGQMECLKLITANSLIEKRIGYLGLTQLFHQKSQLLTMATNRIRVDLSSNNTNIVGLTLCVLSQICTSQLSKQLHNQVLKCVSNTNSYIRKKAILTAIKIIKKSPQYIPQFIPKISSCLEQKNHGVLLSCMAFLENVLTLDQSMIGQLVALVPRISRVYRMVVHQTNSDYDIGGVQDPFLQVAILRFLRFLRKHSNKFQKEFAQTLVLSHDNVCSRVSGNLKNGANAVLFQCFQCFMLLEPTQHSRQLISNVLSKFISVKDANSKYLSLFNLNLMAKFDLGIVKGHKGTIIQCLNQNDILIRIMALDLLYIIASPDNVSIIIKQLLNTLLTATDQQFISQLALKICLIVQKHSQSRRWHFDTILKVLILADQSVKQQSAKSLVHLITSTPQLQNYSMTKLFFATNQNPQNDTLCRISLYLMGQLADILPKIKQIQISQSNVLDLIQTLIFRVGAANDTISYGLSALLKLYQKFDSKSRISKMIKSFEAHSDLQVQKRACQYIKLLDSNWDQDRKKQICIPIPVFKIAAQAFRNIPIGDTQIQLDMDSIRMPQKLNINYDQQINANKNLNRNGEQQRQVKVAQKQPTNDAIIFMDPFNDNDNNKKGTGSAPVKNNTFIDDDDIFSNITGGSTIQQSIPVQQSNNIDLGFDFMNPQPVSQPVSQPIKSNTNDDPFNMLGLDLNPKQPQVKTFSTQPQSNSGGFNFLGMDQPMVKQPQPQKVVNTGLNLLGGDDFLSSGPSLINQAPKINSSKFKAYQNPQMQIWMDCVKQSYDTTKIITTYHNKTQSTIDNLSLQVAVMKHLKLVINPLNFTALQPLSQGVVQQTMNVVNSAVGQKKIVMKIKLSYSMNGQKLVYEQKIANFPDGL